MNGIFQVNITIIAETFFALASGARGTAEIFLGRAKNMHSLARAIGTILFWTLFMGCSKARCGVLSYSKSAHEIFFVFSLLGSVTVHFFCFCMQVETS